ncbi:uncharacterized protein YecE (DUF72 family) [Crossiella equi]|uniref:Uncharacterized protein YecE (DUF72 family) n=1 Tax=Crossiella equi TaxID=130796 RepID=A0ABS5ADV0_9PSEU|nr:DUF72 domain-containing protein [Crossiella equi]MBP2474751.1 uncharacterized protein YecE (DUF72 family) [Crossiella equi]
MGDIRIGTAGWSDPELVASGWYPPGTRSPARRLGHYATRFDFVEVNSTYYGLPSSANSAAWAERTPDGFLFNVKAFSLLTHHHTRSAMLPTDLRPGGANVVRQRDLAPEVLDEVWLRFGTALVPLATAGKLGLLVFQFPPWFTPEGWALDYLVECRDRLAPLRIAVELRDPSWFADPDKTLGFLAEHGIAHVAVDMPQGLPGSVPPLPEVTAEDAVVRLHGRSPDWTHGDKRERYRYRYAEEELADWAARIRRLAPKARRTFVAFNNCCADNPQVNAARLRELLA